ncbi:MAG: helix-turn-helix transcriptional regulator [Elusimicrobia bacterium]|nr:helix-turn-helix transcriptional regulator [Elusimicrobiota bacterium]
MTNVYSDEYQSFLRRLRRARREAGLSQRAAGRKLKKTHLMVSRWERGETRVDAVDFMSLAAIYGKPLDYFQPRRRKTRKTK